MSEESKDDGGSGCLTIILVVVVTWVLVAQIDAIDARLKAVETDRVKIDSPEVPPR